MSVSTLARECSVDGCDRDFVARGWCLMHYKRWRNHGSTAAPRVSPLMSLDERLRYHGWTVQANGCWTWDGTTHHTGRGVLYIDGCEMQAHRAAYEAWVGPIPEGRVVRHSCDNGRDGCMNPSHLLIGSQRDNSQDMVDRLRFHKKLAPADVREIRRRLAAGANQRLLGEEFGVSQSAIWHIKNGSTWSHLE